MLYDRRFFFYVSNVFFKFVSNFTSAHVSNTKLTVLNTYPTRFQYLKDTSNMFNDVFRCSNLSKNRCTVKIWSEFEIEIWKCKHAFIYGTILKYFSDRILYILTFFFIKQCILHFICSLMHLGALNRIILSFTNWCF